MWSQHSVTVLVLNIRWLILEVYVSGGESVIAHIYALSEFEVHPSLVPMHRMRGGRKKGGETDAE
jgi:hypothetical protein